jgi:hypothetical protein
MQVIDIKESGCNNILRWALSNNANIKEDLQLSSLINDELFYLVTLADVNHFELFRLTQSYRDKLRVKSENKAALQTKEALSFLFPGSYKHKDSSDEFLLSDLAENAIRSFMDLTMQMINDDDIIHPAAVRLFIPMIARTYTIQIPISFMDFISAMNEKEYHEIFNSEYPNNLNNIIDSKSHSIKNMLDLGFIRSTQILKYEARYDQYLNYLKYAPLKSYRGKTLYRFALLGFAKKDNISRSEVRCSLFEPNSTVIEDSLRRMSKLKTPLELDFVIQLPIHYMQILENSFSGEILPTGYVSSMTTIINTGLEYDDFKLSEFVNTTEEKEVLTEEQKQSIINHNNSIEAYRVRIASANEVLLKSIPLIINSKNDVDITSVFAMLPSIYMSNAVITINTDYLSKLNEFSDPLISEMFQSISHIIDSINEDIRKFK